MVFILNLNCDRHISKVGQASFQVGAVDIYNIPIYSFDMAVLPLQIIGWCVTLQRRGQDREQRENLLID